MGKGRERGDKGTFVDWLAIEPPKACHLGASSDQKPDRHGNKPEMKMPTPNGGWHGDKTSSYWDAIMNCSAAEWRENLYCFRKKRSIGCSEFRLPDIEEARTLDLRGP
jgi:hypothetical protein